MKIGYITASHHVMIEKKRIGYFYRVKPRGNDDSGWTVMSGEEDQAYADDAANFSLYNASTIVTIDPAMARFLGRAWPVAFERDPTAGVFVEVHRELTEDD